MDEMNYCQVCGTKLETRYDKGDYKDDPYCPKCHQFRYPNFSAAVSMIIYTLDKKKVLLAKKSTIPHWAFVAGYISKGESAEETVDRELKEETGLDVISKHINGTAYFARSNTLILNFTVYVEEKEIHLSDELDKAEFLSIEEAEKRLDPNSLAGKFYAKYHL